MEISESEKKALDIMKNPQGITSEDVETLQGETLQDCRLLNDISILLKKDAESVSRDIEKELLLFHHKHRQKGQRHRMIRWGVAAVIAAALLVGMIFLLDNEPMVSLEKPIDKANTVAVLMKADPSPQEVTLEVEDEQHHREIYSLEKIKETPVIRQTATVHTKEINYFDKNTLKEKVNSQTHVLRIPYGKMFKLILSDGTEVYLNAGSRLIYPTKFVRKERNVTLEGEAYFKVAKDKERPFIVQAGGIQTRVLGTEFNISSYSASDVHVTLIEGSVQVEASGQSKVITPGQDLCVRKDGSVSIKEVDLHSYIYWRDGYFYFDNQPLNEVLQSIGRWYNVGVEFRNIQAMDCKVHFLSDRFQGLEHTLTLLNRMEKASISLKGRTLIVN